MKKRDSFTAKQLIEMYNSSCSVPAAAEKLGCNRKSLWRWLKDLGVDVTRKSYRSSEHSDWGEFAKWLRKFDGTLPKSIPAIAKLAEVSEKAVESYLYRVKRRRERSATETIKRYIAHSTAWPDGSLLTPEDTFTVTGDLWSHNVIVHPEGAKAFKLGVKTPDGYRRKN